MSFIESLSTKEKRRIVCKIVVQLTDFTQQEAEAGFDEIIDFLKGRLVQSLLETPVVQDQREEIIKAKTAILLKDEAVGLKVITDKEISDMLFASTMSDPILRGFFLAANAKKYWKIIEGEVPLWHIKKGCPKT